MGKGGERDLNRRNRLRRHRHNQIRQIRRNRPRRRRRTIGRQERQTQQQDRDTSTAANTRQGYCWL